MTYYFIVVPRLSYVRNLDTMNKYKAKKIVHDGITFDSKKEFNRYLELLAMADGIKDLQRQVKFQLTPKMTGVLRTERASHYIADFTYCLGEQKIVEDVKSDFTRKLPLYILKRKLMKMIHNIEIVEI